MMTFDDLAAGYYNALTVGLGLPASGVQLLQPTVVLPDTAALWSFLDRLPPVSLYRPPDDTARGSLFDVYTKILAALEIPSRNRFVEAVGPDVADEFLRFLSTRSAEPPAANAYPATFRNWALLHRPAVALAGTTALAGMLLEPLGAASVALLGYRQQAPASRPGRPPDWDRSLPDLVSNLASAPSREFSASTATMVLDVTSTWAQGVIGSHPGLWGSSTPATGPARTFAAGDLRVRVQVGHLLLLRPVPGPWYSAAALDIAFSDPGTPPWAPGAALDRDRAFGADGLLPALTAALVVVDSLEATVESAGPYHEDDQQAVLDNRSSGLWPVYLTAGARTTCAFGPDGALTLRITTDPGVPVLLGVVTTSISNYLGHATAT